ncbi:histidine-rich glycoprotein-like [Bicyclus anynana]|uniref:Histidine-rich glycoprotein-like n=1 Tax=Bicyclus anynana TaxID=110368 RepID=A0ABM3LEU4_BICAN|nr:histidine-rich glycoprotein-like [Bicyclus anynana]
MLTPLALLILGICSVSCDWIVVPPNEPPCPTGWDRDIYGICRDTWKEEPKSRRFNSPRHCRPGQHWVHGHCHNLLMLLMPSFGPNQILGPHHITSDLNLAPHHLALDPHGCPPGQERKHGKCWTEPLDLKHHKGHHEGHINVHDEKHHEGLVEGHYEGHHKEHHGRHDERHHDRHIKGHHEGLFEGLHDEYQEEYPHFPKTFWGKISYARRRAEEGDEAPEMEM